MYSPVWVSFPTCRVLEAVAMEPAWRQQGRGRGRSQEGQGERSRPLQKERERPGAAAGVCGAGRGGRTKSATTPEPQRGEDSYQHGTIYYYIITPTGYELRLSVTDRCVRPVQVRGDQEVQPGCCSAIGREPYQLLLL